MSDLIFIVLLFFLIALIYSSAGFGGGSSYLAILTLFGFEFIDLRMLALVCNIVVVSSSVFLFVKHGQMIWRKVIPLVLLSVPLAFIGGSLNIEAHSFYIILGSCLVISALLMSIDTQIKTQKLPKYSNAVIGGGIGFLSGLIGIGGGIFLSPLLHLSKWDKPKIIAATSALFILVNSIAGLIGQIFTHGFNLDRGLVISLICAVFLGGQIGVRLTLFRFRPIVVKRVTAFVIMLAGLRILFLQLNH